MKIIGNINISLTNITMYLIIASFICFNFSILATNIEKLVSNSWSLFKETIYDTVYSIVISQINNKNGQIFFPFMFSLFIFIYPHIAKVSQWN